MAVFYGWWIVLASFILSFYIAGSVFYSFTAFVEPLVAEFGWSYTQISIAASLRGLEMGILAPVVGIFIDRFGPRIVILFGMIISGFGLIFLGMTHSLVMFYGAFILLGLGAGGCTSLVLMTAVANWFRKRVSLALGLTAAGFGTSGLLVPVIVWMIDCFQWRTTLLVLGLTAWAIGIPLSLVIRGRPEKYGYQPDGEAVLKPTSSPVKQESSQEIPKKSEDIPLKEAIRDKNFWYFNVAESIRMMVLMSIIMHVMPYLSSIGVPRNRAGLAAGALALISVSGRIVFGYLGDVFDKKQITITSHALMALGLVVFAWLIKGPWSLFLFLILFSPGYGGGMIMRAALLREYYGTLSYGKILGITMGFGTMAGIIGTTLAGWIFDILGSYRILWIGYIGLELVAIAFIFNIKFLNLQQADNTC